MSLTPAELAAIRDTADNILPDTCTIQTLTRASDGMGGWVDTWANTHTGVACRLGIESSGVAADAELEQGQRLVALRNYVLTLKYDQTIQPHDRVIVGGNTYEIAQVLDGHSWITVKRVSLVRLD